jgi:hypothetical protein
MTDDCKVHSYAVATKPAAQPKRRNSEPTIVRVNRKVWAAAVRAARTATIPEFRSSARQKSSSRIVGAISHGMEQRTYTQGTQRAGDAEGEGCYR